MAYGDGRELEKFEIAMEAIGLAWWWMELPSGAVFFSPNKARMLGRKSEDFVHYKHFTDLVHPDDYERIMQDMRNHIEGEAELYETTYRIKHINGEYVRFFDKGKIVGRKGKEVLIAGFVFNAEEYDKPFPTGV